MTEYTLFYFAYRHVNYEKWKMDRLTVDRIVLADKEKIFPMVLLYQVLCDNVSLGLIFIWRE